jgi:hypothetical protein
MAKPQLHNPVELGSNYGHLKLGHINLNNTHAGVLLRNGPNGAPCEHYMMFGSSGKMNGSTINRCPGVYQIHCGEKPVDNVSFMLKASDGDIVIRAPLGRIRFEAKNIDMIANGSDNKSGYINIESNEKINIRSKNIEVNGDAVAKFLSSGVCELVGNGSLNFYGGLIDCADSCTTLKPSKGISKFETQQKTGGFL